MAELVTQLQDELFKISWKFRDCVGALQASAPPKAVSNEVLLAKPPAPGFDVPHNVKLFTTDIIEMVKQIEALLQQLPENLQHPPSGDLPSKQNFESEVRQLQEEHQQVTKELASAVDEVEGLLQQLQQMYAALAQEKLQSMAGSNSNWA